MHTRAILLALATLACERHAVPALDDASADPPEAGVRALAEAIPEDLARQGPRGWLRHFRHDSTFYMASNGKIVFPTFAAADSAMATMAHSTRAMHLRWLDVRVVPVSATAAELSSPFEEAITDTGGRVREYRGFFTGMAVRVDSGWQLQSLHWSLTPPDSAR